MSKVTQTFSKNQIKAICFIAKRTFHRYPSKYSAILSVLENNGFTLSHKYVNGKQVFTIEEIQV